MCPNCGSKDLEFISGDYGTGVFAPDGAEEKQYQEGYYCPRCGGSFEKGDLEAAQQEWWRQDGAKEIHRGKSDGQQFTCVFARNVGSQIEYAVVECSDGDYLDCVFGGFTLKGETVTLIERD